MRTTSAVHEDLAAAAATHRPPSEPAALTELARALGNQRVAGLAESQARFRPSMPALARYQTERNYAPGGGDGTLFESQALDTGTGAYTRTRKGMQRGLVVSERESLDPTGGPGGTGAYKPQDTRRAGLPPIKVSQNARFAVEDTGQPRNIFIQDASFDTVNQDLETKDSPVRLNRTGMQITLPAAGGRPAAVTLTQASAVEKAKKDVVAAKFEDLETEKLNLIQVECNLVAGRIVGGGGDPSGVAADATAGSDAAATPAPGQIYQYKNRSAAEIRANTSAGVEDMPWKQKKPGFFSKKPAVAARKGFAEALEELRGFDDRMARLDESYTMLHAMQGTAGLSDEAKSLMPGWGNHYEGVIAADGGDTLTLVNYNRNAEASWVVGHELRKAMRDHKKLHAQFKKLYEASAAKMNQPTNQFDPVVFAQMLKQDLTSILTLLQGHAPAGAARATRAREGQKVKAGNMWYFSLYGQAGQSFHETFKTLGGRGMTEGQTNVLGTPA